MNPTLRSLATGIFVAVAGIGLLGCKSLNQSASASFASVRIEGHTAEQICAASVVVAHLCQTSSTDVVSVNGVLDYGAISDYS